MPSAGLDRFHRLADHRLVQRDLLGGQRHEQVRLGLARQFGRDAGVGLPAPQQERPDQGGEPGGRVGVAVPLDRHRHPAGERLQVAEQARRRPVEDRPQVRQPVLHRCSGQRDPGGRGHRPQLARGPRQRVLRVLRLVGDHQAPADLGEPGRVPQHHAVGDQDDLVDGQILQVPAAAVVAADRDVGGEPAHLALPGAEQRRRADHERRSRFGLPPVQVQRDHLDRLAQPHVVGEAAAEPGIAHRRQPGQAPPLIGPQRRRQPGRRLEGHRGGRDAGDPGGQVGERAFRDHRHRLAVDLRRAREHGAERLGRAHPRPRRPAQPVEQGRVEDHPAAPQPDQRPFRLGQGGDLVGVEQRAVERELPPEIQQRLPARTRRPSACPAPAWGRPAA